VNVTAPGDYLRFQGANLLIHSAGQILRRGRHCGNQQQRGEQDQATHRSTPSKVVGFSLNGLHAQ
jgi:hypothetical protein